MENVVSARRLRKSMLKDIDYNSINTLNKVNVISRSNGIRRASKTKNLEENEKRRLSFKGKVIIKTFLSVLIIFVTLICKLSFKDSVLKNKMVGTIVAEYKKDWSKECVSNKVEELSKSLYSNIKYVVPDKIKLLIVDKYLNIVKPAYTNFNLYSSLKNIMTEEKNENTIDEEKKENEDNIKKEQENKVKEEKKEEINGVGGAEPLAENIYEESVSAISSMNQDVERIKAKNINIVAPVNGVITSLYGARDEIFEGVNSYHTGTDIANVKGTKVTSATTGKVVSVVHNNYVEVETDGVIFKYAHLDSISVNEGSDIKQSEEIGLMGSTGMSTGPHLHFEIKIDSRTVDPQELVSL